MAIPKLYAGVDGGGSKTAAVIVDIQGRELGRGIAGASNYQGVGLEVALRRVREALAVALQQAGASSGERPTSIVLGLAGIDRPEDHARWQAALNEETTLADKVELCGDFDLILYALPERRGLGIIAGTGSIAVGRDGRKASRRARAGGWGHFIGDEGSGLWLGREALNAASRAADGRGAKTELLSMLLKEWDLKEPSDLIGAVYGSSSDKGVNLAQIAQVAELVFKAADAGDDFARILLQNAVNELAQAIKACDRQLYFEKPPSLAVAGSLLLKHPPFLQALTHRLEAMLTIGEVVPVDDPALVAAKAAIG